MSDDITAPVIIGQELLQHAYDTIEQITMRGGNRGYRGLKIWELKLLRSACNAAKVPIPIAFQNECNKLPPIKQPKF